MPQDLIGAPVLCQLNRRTRQVPLMLLQLRFKTREEREGVGGGSSKSCQDLLAEKAPDFLGAVFNHAIAEGYLPVAGHNHAAVTAYAQNGSRTDFCMGHNLLL